MMLLSFKFVVMQSQANDGGHEGEKKRTKYTFNFSRTTLFELLLAFLYIEPAKSH